MLRYAIIFLVIALIAAILGFGVLVDTAAWIARTLLLVFLIMALLAWLRRNA